MHSKQRAYEPKYCYLPNQNCPLFGGRADLDCSRRFADGKYRPLICISLNIYRGLCLIDYQYLIAF
jgi:hypothetical protein